MTAPAISVEGIGKLYQLAHQSNRNTSFREALMLMALAPWRRFRQLSGTDASMEDFWALRDVSFVVQPGEVVGIVGRNGAGKSTLLKILSRITEPTEGRAVMRGRIASLLEVGTGFHPELSGRENVYLNGSILGMKRSEIAAKFDDIVAFAEVEKFLDTPVKRYSSGMYVRLAFAVAAHLEPEILIVDEVLAVGDAEFQKRCLGKMKQISQGGDRTVLFVSHNLTAVRSLCSSGILLAGGRVQFQGSVADVADAYAASYSSAKTHSGTIEFKKPRDAPLWMRRVTLTADAIATSMVPMGASLVLDVEFSADNPIRFPRIGYVLQTAEGTLLLNSNNRFQRSPGFEKPEAHGIIRCDLGEMPLMPGEYKISLWLGDMGTDYHVELEAIAFEVIERDLWGTGQTPPKGTFLYWPTEYDMVSLEQHAVS